MTFWLPVDVDIDTLSDQYRITIAKYITTHLKGLPPKMLMAQVNLKELELNNPNHINFIKYAGLSRKKRLQLSGSDKVLWYSFL
jgi:hypothetical protein